MNRNIKEVYLKIDTTKQYTFELKVINYQELKIDYFENEKLYTSQVIEYKVKKDGFVYLKNKNVKPIMIPYFAGAIDIKKIRISINVEGKLIFEVYNHRSGALLLIMFLDGKTTLDRYLYKKM